MLAGWRERTPSKSCSAPQLWYRTISSVYMYICCINRASAQKCWPGGANERLPSHISGDDGDDGEILTDIFMLEALRKNLRICCTPSVG